MSESGPLRSLEQAIVGEGGSDQPLQERADRAGNAGRIAATRRRPLVFRFAGGTDSVALVDLGDAASLADAGQRSS